MYDFSYQDDGLETVSLNSWSLHKLNFLYRLLDIFSCGMKAKFPVINFINLFCGPGVMLDESTKQYYQGSPLVSLNLPYPFTHYYFCDSESTYIKALQTRTQAHASKISFYLEDANEAVHTIVSDIHHRSSSWKTLNLAFMDQYAFELHWDTVESLSRAGKMDLLIFYPESAINRNIEIFSKVGQGTAMDSFFGSEKWRSILTQKPGVRPCELQRDLLDFYHDNLCSLGYRRSDPYEPPIKGHKNSILYRLLFASKHDLGEKFWKIATSKDYNGQLSLDL